MGRKKIPGLVMRAGNWHIDKYLFGRRICQSTGTARLEEAEKMLARLMEEVRQAQVYGVRPARTFEQAAAKYVLEQQHKRSLQDDVSRLNGLLPWIGNVQLDKLHIGTLQPWIAERRRSGVSVGTINHGLQIVRRIMNLAAGEWIYEQGLTWLQSAPRIKLFPNREKRPPYPLTWEEQSRLLRELPDHLAEMAL
jgi:integrase